MKRKTGEGCALFLVTLVVQIAFFGLFYWIFKHQLHAPTWAAFGFAYLITFIRPSPSK